jgi:hypothetical protein
MRFEDNDGDAGFGEVQRSGQAREAGADDADIGSGVGRERRRRGSVRRGRVP